ncbi:MAG: lipopolysaccharide heptosyltransferase II [Elusimicrobia bacterium CG06_land_8_20_14_3_00_38_11]|nr:MAG: lipopolysaccharide heptosyltransferase II [Elusimicrobia bacterium CG06_land_8_20_14_3_00_38_11]
MKILIIQTAFLGDVVLTIPLIQAAKKYLKAQISVVCIPSTKNILEGHPSIDEIIVFDKKNSEKGFFSLIKFIKKLKEKKFDVAIIPHPSFKSGLISYLAAIPERIGFSNSAGRFFFTNKVFFDKNKHQLERYLDLLKHFGIEVKEEKTEIYIDEEGKKFADDVLPKNKIIFGINPGSIWATKRWPAEKYAQLADKIITEFGAEILIFGGPDDIDIAKNVEKNMEQKAINFAGKTTLKQLSVLTQMCKVFVTNDSGPMHIAAAMNIPVVAIFGPTIKQFGFFPYSKKAIVIEKNVPCRPCSPHGPNKCPEKHFNCMNKITVSEVFDAVKKQYENS